ncbi:MAG: hypothetical protein HFJ38_07070 [Bacilli bacterium]|nr:hypothetical protein [Bacilli bacterium]
MNSNFKKKLKCTTRLVFMAVMTVIFTRCKNRSTADMLDFNETIVEEKTVVDDDSLFEFDGSVCLLANHDKILQLVLLNMGEDTVYRIGYLYEEEGILYLKDAFEQKSYMNLSYLAQISEKIEIYRCSFADLLKLNFLLSNEISKEQAYDILEEISVNYLDEMVQCGSRYSHDEEVYLDNIGTDILNGVNYIIQDTTCSSVKVKK